MAHKVAAPKSARIGSVPAATYCLQGAAIFGYEIAALIRLSEWIIRRLPMQAMDVWLVDLEDPGSLARFHHQRTARQG